MTISVLDRNRVGGAVQGDLGDLHDAAAQVDDELLPCHTNDAELWFAESPSDVEYAKTLCQDCPSRPCASAAPSNGVSRGVSGAANSSFRVW